MQPTQPEQPPMYSIDYLNQLAPKTPKQRGFRPRTLVILISTLLVLFIGVTIFSFSSSGPNIGKVTHQLAARVVVTKDIADKFHPYLKSTPLRSLNGNLEVYLTNFSTSLIEPAAAAEVSVAKINEAISAVEVKAAKELSDKLEDARLAGTLDRTYAREMSYQLDTIVVLMRQLYSMTDSETLKSYLEISKTNLEPIQEDFAEFTAANS